MGRRAATAAFAVFCLLAAAPAAAPPPFDPMNDRDAETFPRAHGAHPGAGLEWWYLTGIVRDAERRRMGFQLTFFRVRVADRPNGASAWRPGDLLFGHFAISDLAARFFQYDERAGRTSVALAGSDSTDLNVWIRDWTLRRNEDGSIRLHAFGTVGTLDLTLTPPRATPVQWGPHYRSDKSPDGRVFSRYQSHPRLRAAGSYVSPGDTARSVSGSAWYDHEWTNVAADSTVVGWDWFGLRLGAGRSLMLYRLRDVGGETSHFFGGLVEPRGAVRTLAPADVQMSPLRFWTSPRTGARYPVSWKIVVAVPGESPLAVELDASLNDQELDTARSTRVVYWEGAVEGRARQADAMERVEGYMELTGYAGGGVPGSISTSAPRDR